MNVDQKLTDGIWYNTNPESVGYCARFIKDGVEVARQLPNGKYVSQPKKTTREAAYLVGVYK